MGFNSGFKGLMQFAQSHFTVATTGERPDTILEILPNQSEFDFENRPLII